MKLCERMEGGGRRNYVKKGRKVTGEIYVSEGREMTGEIV